MISLELSGKTMEDLVLGPNVQEFKDTLRSFGLTCLDDLDKVRGNYEVTILDEREPGVYVGLVDLGTCKMKLIFPLGEFGIKEVEIGSKYMWIPTEDGSLSEKDFMDIPSFKKTPFAERREAVEFSINALYKGYKIEISRRFNNDLSRKIKLAYGLEN